VVLGADRICGAIENSEIPYRKCMIAGQFEFSRWAREAFPAMFPLSFLMVLPNMIASHISIAHDARGPNNTIHHGEVSSLLAVIEAARVIERGWADAMIAGGASSQMHPTDWVRHCLSGRLSTRQGDPASVMRPFDADRDGEAWGEGGAAFVLETRQHAEARGATILARVIGSATTFEPSIVQRTSGSGLRRAIVLALTQSRVRSGEVAYIKAHGLSTVEDDSVEARAICDVLPNVPVTAPKSYFGNLGAAGGAVEMAVTVQAFQAGVAPPTLNFCRSDPRCPVNVLREPQALKKSTVLLVNWTASGQSAALVIARS
jgi:3-oxoacyl-[acyl-carrier-protein] synthase II